MIYMNSRHLMLNRILLLAIGLWPYYQSKLTDFQFILILSIETSFICFQLTTFTNAELTFSFIVDVLSSTLCFVNYVIILCMFRINIQNVKLFMEQIQQICNGLTDKNEIAIIKEEDSNSKRLLIKATFFSICIICCFNIISTYSIADIFPFLNNSEYHDSKIIETEYFISENKYYYLILFHQNTAVSILVIGMLAIIALLLVLFAYVCGMFRIVSYRIEQAMTKNMLKNTNLTRGIAIYRKIIVAVDIHCEAIRLTLVLFSMVEIGLFVVTFITVLCLSLNLLTVVLLKNNVEKLLLPFSRSSLLLFCLFIPHYNGERVIDCSNHIFFSTYSVQYYKAPLKVQKLILFLLQRSSKSFKIQVGGLFVASMNSFASMANTALSYFTVMYSMQN